MEKELFYMHCWLEMKHQHPELFEDMGLIELKMASYEVSGLPNDKRKSDDEAPEGVRL